jgi:flavin-dependent dehydrogenase
MYDLIVIGGGPAGSSAAITAAHAGAKVLLLERGRFPRHKVCGEFVSAESLGLLSELLGGRGKALLTEALPISRARVFLDERTLESPINPPAGSIARYDLDAALWQAAIESGVESRLQTSVQQINGVDPFSVATATDNFESPAVINAAGRWSNLTVPAKENGAIREKWVGLKGHFSETAPPPSVDLYFFPGGYCGVQPVNLVDPEDAQSKGGRINLCAMVRAETASTLLDVFWLHPQLRERSRDWQPLSDPVTTAPLFFRTPGPVEQHVLMVGDSAGFVDPFVGDGISLALRSGALAAKSLAPCFSGKVSIAKAADMYRKSYEQTLLPVFRASSTIRKLLALPRFLRGPLITLFQNSPRLTEYLVRRTR